MNLAVLSLRDPDEATRLVPDGRPYSVMYEGMLVEVRVTDERGKVDVNSAEEETLINLFTANGLDGQAAVELAAAIKDWSDSDEVERANGAELGAYEAAGLGVGPGNRAFVMTEELLQVLGMSWDLYTRIEPGISVHSGAALPDAAYAPAEALLALPDMTPQDALNFVAERQSQETLTGLDLSLPSGEVAMARGRGVTYSIVAKATLPNGVWDQVEATVRLGANSNGRPYTVLRWREGTHQ
jgi:general secretion pathway protein K